MRAPTLKAVSFDTLKTIKLIKEKREAIIIKIAIIEGRYIFGWRSKKSISEKFSVLTSLSWDIDLFKSLSSEFVGLRRNLPNISM